MWEIVDQIMDTVVALARSERSAKAKLASREKFWPGRYIMRKIVKA